MYIDQLHDRLLTGDQAPMQGVQKTVTFSTISDDGTTQQHKTVSYKAFERTVLLLVVVALFWGAIGGVVLCQMFQGAK